MNNRVPGVSSCSAAAMRDSRAVRIDRPAKQGTKVSNSLQVFTIASFSDFRLSVKKHNSSCKKHPEAAASL